MNSIESITIPDDVDWNELYELYGQHIDILARDVTEVNISLGSTNPTPKFINERLDRETFEHIMKHPRDVEVRTRWLRCITRQHMEKFPWLFPETDPST